MARRRAPSPLAPLLGDGEQRDQADHERGGTPPVDPGVTPVVAEVQRAVDHEERGDADRDVDQEHPAPAGQAEDHGVAGEEAADHRAEDARRTEHGHEVAGVARPLARRHDVADDREHQGEQATGADPLHGAEGREHVHRGGERAQGRPDDEDRDREHEQLLAAVEVAELAVDRGRDRRGDQVRRGDPGLHGQPVEVVGDGPDRRADDRLVEGTEEHAHHQPDQDGQDLGVGVLAGLAGGGGASGRLPEVGVLIERRVYRCPGQPLRSRSAESRCGAA